MANIDILKAMDASGHPLTGAYNVDNALAAAQANLANISVDSDEFDSWDLFQLFDRTEYNLLTADQHQVVDTVLRLPRLDPNGNEMDFVKEAFGNAGTTVDAINAAGQSLISHATQQKIPVVGANHFELARR